MPQAADHPVLASAARFRAQVAANEQAAATRLAQAMRRAESRLGASIAALEERIAAQDGPMGRGQARRLAALRSLRQQAIDEVNRFAVYADGEIANSATDMIALGLQHSRGLVQAHFGNMAAGRAVAARFDMLPVESVETMLGFLADDSPLRDALVNRLGPLVAGRMADALVTGIATGMGPRQVAALVRRELGVGLTWALNTARTAQLWSYREASRANYAANRDIVAGWIWYSALDARTCMCCTNKHGSRHTVDEVLNGHHSCVVDGTVINSPTILATSKRWFDGNVIDIRTVNGHILTVTENHPILTDHGWIAARALKVGDNVISSRDAQGAISVIDPNDYDRPALIEDVLVSFARSGGVRAVRVPGSREDFHGDGRNGNIDIVRADGFLGYEGDVTFGQELAKPFLRFTYMRLESFATQSPATASDSSALAAPVGGLGDSDASQVFAMRRLLGKESIGINLVAPLNPCFPQAAGNRTASDVEGLGNFVFGFPGNIAENDFANRQIQPLSGIGRDFSARDGFAGRGVANQAAPLQFVAQSLGGGSDLARGILGAFPGNVRADRILEISVRAFSGHVYNLQTSTGWYVANGIITHNCRCTMIPDVPLAARLGITPPQIEPGAEWFARQPEAAQRARMGPGMFDAWKAGAVRFDQLSEPYEDAVYGTMQREPSLVGLLGEKAKDYYAK